MFSFLPALFLILWQGTWAHDPSVSDAARQLAISRMSRSLTLAWVNEISREMPETPAKPEPIAAQAPKQASTRIESDECASEVAGRRKCRRNRAGPVA
jgi:hypothetical protein